MYALRHSSKIKKDLKTCQKRQYDMSLFEEVVKKLRIPELLEPKHRDHKLSGRLEKYRECHITPDWVLIYRYDGECLEVVRTGTHADLFNM